MGTDHGPSRVSQHRLDGSPAKDPSPLDSPRPDGSLAPGADDQAIEERRRQWATERARFEASHPPP